jgi:hypothetical protein
MALVEPFRVERRRWRMMSAPLSIQGVLGGGRVRNAGGGRAPGRGEWAAQPGGGGRLEVGDNHDGWVPAVSRQERGKEGVGLASRTWAARRLGREKRLRIVLKEEGGKRDERGILRVVFRL